MKRTIDESDEISEVIDPIAGDASNSLEVSDIDKLMYIAYRQELLDICVLQFEYDWGYVSEAHKLTNPSADIWEELTIPMIFHEDCARSRYIDRLLARRRLDDAFECAIRSKTPSYRLTVIFIVHCRISFY